RLDQLAFHPLVFVGKFGQRRDVAESGFELLPRFQERVERLELLDRLFGLVGVVPEGRLAHLVSELPAQREFAGDVKESPAAGSGGWSGRWRGGAGRHS